MKNLVTDIAIVAAGPAGLAAAIEGASAGAKVMVFEKSNVTGGTANMGMGPFAVGSHIQKENMLWISKEKAFRMFMDYVHWSVDARLVHDYFWKSADTIQWLEDMGVTFFGAMKYYPEGEATWHVVQPEGGGMPGPRAAATMTKRMTEKARELGVEFYMNTSVQKLLYDEEKVYGLTATDADGEELEVEAKAVVIATGGFGSNTEMIREELGFDYGSDLFSIRVPGVVGDGIKMAWEAGAGKGHMEIEMVVNAAMENEDDYMVRQLFGQGCVFMVNKNAERFMDESEGQNLAVASTCVFNQPEGYAYAIIDTNIVRHLKQDGLDFPSGVFHCDPTENYKEEIARMCADHPESVWMADSIPALAEKIGLDPAVLQYEVDLYNECCEQNYDDIMCKDRQYLIPLIGKQYYALKLTAGGYGTLGGIRVNHKLEVLTDQFEVRKGLYAAGSDVCDLYRGTYLYKLPGNTMGFALNSGRIAGENAASYVLG